MDDQLTEAISRAAEYGAPPGTFEIGPAAAIKLADGGIGHLLNGATITHWSCD